MSNHKNKIKMLVMVKCDHEDSGVTMYLGTVYRTSTVLNKLYSCILSLI